MGTVELDMTLLLTTLAKHNSNWDSYFFQDDTSSVISFTSSIHSLNDASMTTHRTKSDDVDDKADAGASLLELFGSNDAEKLSRTFLAMSSSPANCDNVRHIFFLPFLFPSCQIFLPLISAQPGFHDWGLVTRWAELLITSNYYLPSTLKD